MGKGKTNVSHNPRKDRYRFKHLKVTNEGSYSKKGSRRELSTVKTQILREPKKKRGGGEPHRPRLSSAQSREGKESPGSCSRSTIGKLRIKRGTRLEGTSFQEKHRAGPADPKQSIRGKTAISTKKKEILADCETLRNKRPDPPPDGLPRRRTVRAYCQEAGRRRERIGAASLIAISYRMHQIGKKTFSGPPRREPKPEGRSSEIPRRPHFRAPPRNGLSNAPEESSKHH